MNLTFWFCVIAIVVDIAASVPAPKRVREIDNLDSLLDNQIVYYNREKRSTEGIDISNNEEKIESEVNMHENKRALMVDAMGQFVDVPDVQAVEQAQMGQMIPYTVRPINSKLGMIFSRLTGGNQY